MEHSEAPASPIPSNESATGEPGHWCHQCNSAIVVEPVEGGDLICPDCGGGFIEAMDSASTLATVRRAARRQRRRQRQLHGSRALGRLVEDGTTEEELEDASPQQVLRFLRFLARTFRNSPPPLSSRSSDALTSDRTHESYDSDGRDLAHDEHGVEVLDPSAISSRRGEGEADQTEDDHGEAEVSAHVEGDAAVEESAENIESSLVLDGDGDEEDVEDEDDEESDSEVEAGLLELSDWESLEEEDEDEWEEVEFNGTDLVVRFLEAVDDGIDGEGEVVGEDRQQDDAEGPAVQVQGAEANGPIGSNRARAGNALPRSLRRRLQAIRRSLENYNTEVQLEAPDFDTYIGNPGDYVDARGFEELLQQLIDTDNTRRGAPPAAKSAIERLSSVKIQQENWENGSALCAICKDVVALNEPAKQLPCLHLYHSACILPWLNARNSCPVCRYELPTDDPDYEEQRKRQSSDQIVGDTGNVSSNSSTSDDAGGEVTGTEGNTSGEATQTDSAELHSDKGKGSKDEFDSCNCVGEGHSSNEARILRKRSFVEALAGSLFSVVGLVVVSCLGNLIIGGNFQMQQRLRMGNSIEELGKVHNHKPWWMRLFG